MMSLAVYNSSDVDISRYITDISGLEKHRNINNQITIPKPTIKVHSLNYNIDDELYILEDGVKKFHLFINKINYNYETLEYEWKCSDILYKLKEKKVSGLSSTWWTLGNWHDPSTLKYYYGEYEERCYISVMFMIKVILHIADPDLVYADMILNVEDEDSPYCGNAAVKIVYRYIGLQFNMFKFIGRPSNSDDEWDCLNLFDTLNWLLDTLRLQIEYSDEKYYIKTVQPYIYPSNNKIYKRKNGLIERYGNIHVRVFTATMNDYASSPVELDELEVAPTNIYEGEIKSVSLPNSFYLFLITPRPYPNLYRLVILGGVDVNHFERQYFDVVLNNFYYPIYTTEIETDITADNTPYENKFNVEKLRSIIKCKDPDFGFPFTLPLTLR